MFEVYLSFLLGVLMLIGGIFIMRTGLKKLFWHSLKTMIEGMTKTPWRSFITGTAAAAMMQSSTAVSLLTIGFVSADYLSFHQGLGIILGANIGTCSTVQLMTLSLPDTLYLPLLLGSSLGFLFIRRFRYPFLALTGLFSMFIGMMVLSNSLGKLVAVHTVFEYLSFAHANPFYGILSGTLLTLLFQSSSAATGITMVLAADNLVDLTTAAYIVYGNNIGSCLSSLVIGAAAPLAARRVAISHFVLNLGGVLIFLPLTPLLILTTQTISSDFAAQIALFHTLFNILSSLAVFPFLRQYAQLIMFLVPGK